MRRHETILTPILVCVLAIGLPALAAVPAGDDAPLRRVKTVYVDYPESLQEAKLGADLTVLATVHEDGSVDVQGMQECKVSHWKRGAVADSTESCGTFFEAAREAIQGWRYRPIREDGHPVEARLLIPLSFEKKHSRASIHAEKRATGNASD